MIEQEWRDYGHRLRVTRLALDLFEKEAADTHGVTVRTYRKYENGGRQRGQGFVASVKRYNVSFHWLMSGETSRLGTHLAKRARGKVAILPSSWRRR
jgi:hypothetical protein